MYFPYILINITYDVILDTMPCIWNNIPNLMSDTYFNISYAKYLSSHLAFLWYILTCIFY